MNEILKTGIRKCLNCNKEFKRYRDKFCSRHCYLAAPRVVDRKLIEVECLTCKKIFLKPTCLAKRSVKHFCCKIHQHEYRKIVEVACKICNRQIVTCPSIPRVYCSRHCRDSDPDKSARCAALNAKLSSGKINKFEQRCYDLLDLLEVKYESQKLIAEKFCVDAFVENHNLVIQFDGDYWHAHPIKYPNPDAKQLRRINLDKSQDKYMEKCGLKVFRIWESDLKNHYDLVKKKLLTYFSGVT